MKAIRVRAFGGPEVMQLETVPDPTPGPGQVLVRMMSAGVNPVETYIRSGNYGRLPDLPYTPGSDGAGVVLAGDLPAGQRVWVSGTLSGTYAETALCEATQVFPLPERISFAQGSALGIPYTTAYRALFQRGEAKPGETVLIHGATGGVGVAAVQFANAAGLRVLATGGSETGRAMLTDQGADEVFDHTAPGYADAVLRASDGKGVNVIVEMLANENLAKDLTMLARFGRIVVVGSRGATELNPREIMIRDADIRGLVVFNCPEPELAECHAAVSSGLAKGVLTPVTDEEFPIEQAPKSHQAIMMGGHHGKVTIRCTHPA